MTENSEEPGPEDLRTAAIRRLRERSEFFAHLRAFLIFSLFLSVLWALGGGGFFWPAFPMVCWGIWVVVHAARFLGGWPVTEERVQREMQRLSTKR